MTDISEDSSSDESSITSNEPDNSQSNVSPSQTTYHRFRVYCLSKKKILKDNKYTSVDNIKKDAFALYEEGEFNDNNAILTHLNDNKVEVLLTSVPDLLKKNSGKKLFIRFVYIF